MCEDARAERIARYKESRRRQLAEQFNGTQHQENGGHNQQHGDDGSALSRRRPSASSGTDSCSSGGINAVKTTKTYRLRAAANNATTSGTSCQNVTTVSGTMTGHRRDSCNSSDESRAAVTKSTSEQSDPFQNVTKRRIDTSDRDKSSKRKSNLNRSLNSEEVVDDDVKNRRIRRRFFPQDILDRARDSISGGATSVASTSSSPRPLTPRKSDLSIHMENARRSLVRTPSLSSTPVKSNSPRGSIDRDRKSSMTSPTTRRDSGALAKKMVELTALTKETLARVDALSKRPSSILKKKSSSEEETLPVSILKKGDDDRSAPPPPPVTFSPSVVEPAQTSRKSGGILKKRRSLDESQVLRHRSCSPETSGRSILKQQQQRRSSLEDLDHAHGILKRHSEDLDSQSQSSPHSILKRRSGNSSAGSGGTGSTHHVSIATAVVLAAAGGAELVPPPHDDVVKPILKKNRSGDETPDIYYYNEGATHPRPILKKKSSTDTDQEEADRPRPILKASAANQKPRLSFSEGGDEEEGRRTRRSHTIGGSEWRRVGEHQSQQLQRRSDGELDQSDEGEEGKQRPLSVSELVMNFETTGAVPKKSSLKRGKERCKTQPITYDELEASLCLVKSPQLERTPASTSSPLNYYNNTITSSLENDSRLNSNNISLVDVITAISSPSTPSSGGIGKMSADSAFQSLGDGLELEDEARAPTPEVGERRKKGVESAMETQMRALAQEAQKLALSRVGGGNAGLQKYRTRKEKSDKLQQSSNGRFATQPVTFDEVQEASRLAKNEDESDEGDPSKLSLSERIMLFNKKVRAEDRRELPTSPPSSIRRCRQTRFQTQPVTLTEVRSAKGIVPNVPALDERAQRPRSILKPDSSTSSSRGCRRRFNETLEDKLSSPRISMTTSPANQRAESQQQDCDVTQDEGISCNDSASDSEVNSSPELMSGAAVKPKKVSKFSSQNKARSGSDTEGESSGGREIRSIFKNENKLRVKQALENVLLKSQSQSNFVDGGDAGTKIAKNNNNSSSLMKTIGGAAPIRKSATQAAMMPRTIAEIQARLHQSGESDWRKRVPQNNNANDELKSLKDKNRYNDEKSILAAKKDELDASARQWKQRVDKNDAEKFSVAGKMLEKQKNGGGGAGGTSCINLPATNKLIGGEKQVKMPQAKRFKGKNGTETASTPTSPEKTTRPELTRSHSVPDPALSAASTPQHRKQPITEARVVSVSRPDDDTFTSFFKSNLEHRQCDSSRSAKASDVITMDLDSVKRHSLLVQKKNVQMRNRRATPRRNPIKALAMRDDIRTEYTEVLTGLAEREQKRIAVEKLAARNTNFALESLAGLASKEKFTEVQLKKQSAMQNDSYVPFKSVMLLHVKGRRHVQTRLVAPSVDSLNEGDVFLLVTKNTLYIYTGRYANVIETSRASDVANHVLRTGDLGCKDVKIVPLDKGCANIPEQFWKILRSEPLDEFVDAGAPEEDEIYENNILATNMIYELEGDELIPSDYWGQMPKMDILGVKKVLVFDFGTEMYVWSGKQAPLDRKKLALKLAKQLWEEGYNYGDCDISPLDVAAILGDRKNPEKQKLTGPKRPEWALFAKLTQHRETVLFKEKFLDWPDFTRVIRVKNDSESDRMVSEVNFNIEPCDIPAVNENDSAVDLVVEGCHLGRGDRYYDAQSRRLFEFETLSVTVWRILENHTEKLPQKSLGHFYSSESYTVRWNYRMTVKGRELSSGKPSKHAQVGRDKVVYFCWQGDQSSTNEKGLAALLTVELDSEHAPQVRVVQNYEPAAFLRLFNGNMCVHLGKPGSESENRLYMLRGDLPEEHSLVEVECRPESLRGRTSFVLVVNESVRVWHGGQSQRDTRKGAELAARRLVDTKPQEMGLAECAVEVEEEGEESADWLDVVGTNPNTLNGDFDYQLRAFHMSSISGKFEAVEVLSPNRKSDVCSPYPVLQTDLYAASQPALFLIDDRDTLWLWQGWWPELRSADESDSSDSYLTDQTGSGAVRWQLERKAAMQTALAYAQTKTVPPTNKNLVWAGLEPPTFTRLFPYWSERHDVAELNRKDDREPGAIYSMDDELEALSRTTYTLDELMQRPLPAGVDPTHLEIYLEAQEFELLLGVGKEEFATLPSWKQTALKKEKGLF